MNKNLLYKIIELLNSPQAVEVYKRHKSMLQDVINNPSALGMVSPTSGEILPLLTGTRPAHQAAIETAYNSGNLPLVKKIIDNIPNTDPYKSGMMDLISRFGATK